MSAFDEWRAVVVERLLAVPEEKRPGAIRSLAKRELKAPGRTPQRYSRLTIYRWLQEERESGRGWQKKAGHGAPDHDSTPLGET